MRVDAGGRAAVTAVAVIGLATFALTGCGAEAVSAGATPTVSISPTSTSTGTPTSTPATSPAPPGDPADPSRQPTPTRSPTVTLTGIPDRAGEATCLVLDTYQLIGGDRTLLSSGVPVIVTGHKAPNVMSLCARGAPLVVD